MNTQYYVISKMGRSKITRIKKCITCESEFNPGKHANKLNCSKECLKQYNLLHKEDRMNKTFDSIEKKYGVRAYSQTEGFSKKIKQIKLERYGDENYNNFSKIQKTLQEKFNVKSPGNIPGNTEKIKRSKLLRHKDENYNNRKQAKLSIQSKFGVDHHLQTNESLDKMKKTNQNLYGKNYTLQLDKTRENLKKYNNIHFNCDYYFSSDKHLGNILNQKISKIQNILEANNISFDVSEYEKLRTKLETGKLKYIKYNLTCNTCNNEFESSFEITPICRKCFPLTSVSKQQYEFKLFLEELNVNFIENTRKIIYPFEIDFYIPDYNLAIELNGNYYHSELSGKLKDYHLNKSILCHSQNIKLIHIFEDEWINKKEIIMSRIKNMLYKTNNTLYARKGTVKTVSFNDKKSFLEQNHIQGNDTSFCNLGLYIDGSLCSIMTFSKPRLALKANKNYNNKFVEISRFCTKLYCNVIGGFEKILNFFIKNNSDIKEIVTFADCRWSGLDNTKTVYNKCNFKFVHLTPPNYFYMFKNNYFNRYHRFTYNKQRLIKLFNADNSMTEWDIAQSNKMDRIWDCGSMKFSLKVN